MTPQQWERAKEIFDAALDLPADRRPAYVHDTCSNEPTIFAEVESLLAANDQVGSNFLQPDWLDPHPPAAPALRPGDVVSGRFRIVRPLGNGGMGQVYEAHDSELGVRIALKTLRPEIAANPEILSRFRQEVRIAHRITHPNVCRTFQFDRELGHSASDGSDPVDLTFITMEFLDGETLQQVLKRTGRLAPDHAHAIAIQMAEAIEAAHHTGIIHRDIKPGNVMICPGRIGEPDRVVITDFGLAKINLSEPANPDLSAISHPGRAMGTLAYMAPEQLEAGVVTAATDIYAFGLVLFEMLTGNKAFPDANTITKAFRRLTDDPPSPRALVPMLPVEWEAAIAGCLQIDPATRFQHATDVIAVLEGADPASLRTSTHSHHSTRNQRTFPHRRANPSRLWTLAAAAALLLCLSLSWPAYRLYQWRANSTVAPGTLVYLAPVKNETGEKQLDNITELVQAGLSQSAHINLLDAGRVSDILQSMTKPPDTVITAPIAREIAMRGGAPRVVFATVTKSLKSYRLDLDIQQTDNTPLSFRHHSSNHWEWQSAPSGSSETVSADLLANIRDASGWVRRTVGESQNDVAQLDAPPEDVTTTSWAALSEYTHAQQLSQRGDSTGAVLALRNAVKLDPGFALAYGRMGDILTAIHQTRDGIAAYLKALDTGADRRLSRRERDRIKAMYAVDTDDYQAADLALRDAISFYENDPLSWAYRVQPLKMLGQPDEAIHSLNKVLELSPNNQFALGELANTWMFIGKYDEARQAIDRVRAVGRFPDLVNELEGHLFFLQSRFADATASFRALARAQYPLIRIKSLPLLARISAERGDYGGALALLDQSVEDSETASHPGFLSSVLLDRGLIRGKLNDFNGMIADETHAIALDPSQQHRIDASSLLGQFSLNAPSEVRAQIRKALEDLLRDSPPNEIGVDSEIANLRIRGEILFAGHDWEGALSLFRQAANLDAPAGARDYLARALTAAAAHQRDRTAARKLEQEALQAYAVVALNPGFVWHHPMDSPIGFYSDERNVFQRLAAQTHSIHMDMRSGDSVPSPPCNLQPSQCLD